MGNFLKNYYWVLILLVAGIIAGFGYYHFIGTDFPATSLNNNPWFTTLYGGVFGGIIGIIIKDLTDSDSKKSIVR